MSATADEQAWLQLKCESHFEQGSGAPSGWLHRMVKRIHYFTRPKTLRCGGGKCFVVHTDEKPTAFLELKKATGESLRSRNGDNSAQCSPWSLLRACPRPENRLQDAI
jgi:hypothetical protein